MLLPIAKRVLFASALFVSSVIATAGCSSTVAQSAAREKATTATCDLADKCELVGDGKEYTDRADCEATIGGVINEAWPAADCTNIQQDAIDSCVDAIKNTACDNAADVSNTFANKCSRASVCGTDAS